jgi:CheY-like chemotaxis protein
MDSDARRAIEPFFSTKGSAGTALAVDVHGLASQLGGALMLSSKPGLGTSAELWLPVSADQVGSAADVPTPQQARAPSGTVLLVDDEAMARESTAAMLSDLGFDIIEADSAEEALRLLDAGLAIDMLVTDHLMPGMSGADLARKLRDSRPDLPVMIVSGYARRRRSRRICRGL